MNNFGHSPAATLEKVRITTDGGFAAQVQRQLEQLQGQGCGAGGATTNQADAAIAAAKQVKPFNQRGGHEPFIFDLGDARFGSQGFIEYPSPGCELVVSIQGSVPGAVLDFDFDAGGTVLQCLPGSVLKGTFSRVLVKRNALSVQTGQVMLRIINQPDVHYTELARGFPSGALGNPSLGGSGPSGATTQAYNSIAGNFPVLATDGVSLTGVSGVRASVEASDGSVILTCIGQWWQFCSAAGVGHKWGQTDMQDVYGIPGGSTALWFPTDKQVWVPEGRIYFEARSFTTISGTSTPIVRLNTWGQ